MSAASTWVRLRFSYRPTAHGVAARLVLECTLIPRCGVQEAAAAGALSKVTGADFFKKMAEREAESARQRELRVRLQAERRTLNHVLGEKSRQVASGAAAAALGGASAPPISAASLARLATPPEQIMMQLQADASSAPQTPLLGYPTPFTLSPSPFPSAAAAGDAGRWWRQPGAFGDGAEGADGRAAVPRFPPAIPAEQAGDTGEPHLVWLHHAGSRAGGGRTASETGLAAGASTTAVEPAWRVSQGGSVGEWIARSSSVGRLSVADRRTWGEDAAPPQPQLEPAGDQEALSRALEAPTAEAPKPQPDWRLAPGADEPAQARPAVGDDREATAEGAQAPKHDRPETAHAPEALVNLTDPPVLHIQPRMKPPTEANSLSSIGSVWDLPEAARDAYAATAVAIAAGAAEMGAHGGTHAVPSPLVAAFDDEELRRQGSAPSAGTVQVEDSLVAYGAQGSRQGQGAARESWSAQGVSAAEGTAAVAAAATAATADAATAAARAASARTCADSSAEREAQAEHSGHADGAVEQPALTERPHHNQPPDGEQRPGSTFLQETQETAPPPPPPPPMRENADQPREWSKPLHPPLPEAQNVDRWGLAPVERNAGAASAAVEEGLLAEQRQDSDEGHRAAAAGTRGAAASVASTAGRHRAEASAHGRGADGGSPSGGDSFFITAMTDGNWGREDLEPVGKRGRPAPRGAAAASGRKVGGDSKRAGLQNSGERPLSGRGPALGKAPLERHARPLQDWDALDSALESWEKLRGPMDSYIPSLVLPPPHILRTAGTPRPASALSGSIDDLVAGRPVTAPSPRGHLGGSQASERRAGTPRELSTPQPHRQRQRGEVTPRRRIGELVPRAGPSQQQHPDDGTDGRLSPFRPRGPSPPTRDLYRPVPESTEQQAQLPTVWPTTPEVSALLASTRETYHRDRKALGSARSVGRAGSARRAAAAGAGGGAAAPPSVAGESSALEMQTLSGFPTRRPATSPAAPAQGAAGFSGGGWVGGSGFLPATANSTVPPHSASARGNDMGRRGAAARALPRGGPNPHTRAAGALSRTDLWDELELALSPPLAGGVRFRPPLVQLWAREESLESIGVLGTRVSACGPNSPRCSNP